MSELSNNWRATISASLRLVSRVAGKFPHKGVVRVDFKLNFDFVPVVLVHRLHHLRICGLMPCSGINSMIGLFTRRLPLATLVIRSPRTSLRNAQSDSVSPVDSGSPSVGMSPSLY